MTRKNFHRVDNPRKAVTDFLKVESDKGNKVYWDKSHLAGNEGANNNPGIGIYCVSVKARGQDDETYAYETSRYMLLKGDAEIEDMFCYYETGE